MAITILINYIHLRLSIIACINKCLLCTHRKKKILFALLSQHVGFLAFNRKHSTLT